MDRHRQEGPAARANRLLLETLEPRIDGSGRRRSPASTGGSSSRPARCSIDSTRPRPGRSSAPGTRVVEQLHRAVHVDRRRLRDRRLARSSTRSCWSAAGSSASTGSRLADRPRASRSCAQQRRPRALRLMLGDHCQIELEWSRTDGQRSPRREHDRRRVRRRARRPRRRAWAVRRDLPARVVPAAAAR